MSQLCYGWMKFRVQSGSPTKTPKKHGGVRISCFISVLVEGGVLLAQYSYLSLAKMKSYRGNSLPEGTVR